MLRYYYLQLYKLGQSIPKRNCYSRVDVGDLRRVCRGSTSFQREQAKLTHLPTNPSKMFSGVILLSFLSINLGYLQTRVGLKSQQSRVLFSTHKDSDTFYPFSGQQLSTASAQLPSSPISNDEKYIPSKEFLRAAPALSALAVLGAAGNADAADSITVPLQGIELYSR